MSNEILNNRYNLTDSIVRQADRIKPSPGKTDAAGNQLSGGKTFQQILNEQLKEKISFSKHANQRTEERNIQISESDLNRLDSACEKAQQKGIKDALIVMNDSAFIVNAANKVVITVVDKNEMKDNVFTNIDGALFV